MNKDVKDTEVMLNSDEVYDDYDEIIDESDLADVAEVKNGIKSKQRVRDHGEVYTPENIVKDMMNLDGIREESYKVESTFLEPACGNGNFLVEIITRKMEAARDLSTVDGELDRSKFDLNVVKATASVYGVDILTDNVKESRQRMLNIIISKYEEYTGCKPTQRYANVVKHILASNIILGDTLAKQMTAHEYIGNKLEHINNEEKPEKMAFTEWHFNGTNVKIKYSELGGTSDLASNNGPSGHYMDIPNFAVSHTKFDENSTSDNPTDDYIF